jgi:cobalt-precorrin-5B (C1)-methyltransferase
VASRNKKLRTGFTTGACAAAAAKAAALLLCGRWDHSRQDVEIPFPDGIRRALKTNKVWPGKEENVAWASIIKDAGDDPDVTNNIEILVRVAFSGATDQGRPCNEGMSPVLIKGGSGVGRITRPGLSVPVGEPAINPIPRRMIEEAVREALSGPDAGCGRPIEVTVSVPEGEKVARKTLNGRLGIVGGISILGTTGIVRPLSAEAWTATISASMSVAREAGREEIVMSSGRTSERAHMNRYGLPEESYVMMGDYVEYALKEAGARGFRTIHLCAQWAKMLKMAMGVPQTHVRHGAIDLAKTISFLVPLGFSPPDTKDFNTAREIFDIVSSSTGSSCPIFSRVCAEVRARAESLTEGVPVRTCLVSYEGEIIAEHG